ncbi:MAG: hypothetical protein ACRCYV_07430 [Aeromonas sp.]
MIKTNTPEQIARIKAAQPAFTALSPICDALEQVASVLNAARLVSAGSTSNSVDLAWDLIAWAQDAAEACAKEQNEKLEFVVDAMCGVSA